MLGGDRVPADRSPCGRLSRDRAAGARARGPRAPHRGAGDARRVVHRAGDDPSAVGQRPRRASAFPRLSEEGDIRSLEAVEADMIRLAFGRYRGRMTEIAKRLGIGRSTLYRKMREIGLGSESELAQRDKGLARKPHSQKKRCRRRLIVQRGVANGGVLTLGSDFCRIVGHDRLEGEH